MSPLEVSREIIDEFELRKLVHTYCRAVDRGDIDRLRDLYHPDAVDAHGEFAAGTIDHFLQELATSRPHIQAMQHNVTTVNFVITDDVAEGEIYTIAVHTIAGPEHDVDLIIGGRYLDKYEKRRDTWKIRARTIVTDWAQLKDPSAMDLTHPITKGTLKGTMDASDPSYQFFSLFGKVPK